MKFNEGTTKVEHEFDRAPETSRRIAAVNVLLQMGYVWRDTFWEAPESEIPYKDISLCVRDAMDGVHDSRTAPDYAVSTALWLSHNSPIENDDFMDDEEAERYAAADDEWRGR